jgi:hypothetical protein
MPDKTGIVSESERAYDYAQALKKEKAAVEAQAAAAKADGATTIHERKTARLKAIDAELKRVTKDKRVTPAEAKVAKAEEEARAEEVERAEAALAG